MARIVPSRYETDDSETVRLLDNFIETMRPDWVRPDFGETFAEFVSENGAHLRHRYGLHLRSGWGPVPKEQQPPIAGGASGTDPRLGYVFYEKMSDDVRRAMLASGIAEPDSSDKRWIGMHPDLARVYMTALAQQLASERGLYPITPDETDHVAAGGLTMEWLAQALLREVDLAGTDTGAKEVESLAVFVAFEILVPTNLDTVPVDRILKFREKYPLERSAFQSYVTSFCEGRKWLTAITDKGILQERLTFEYRKDLKPKLDELREKLREVNIDTVLTATGIQVAAPYVVGWAGALGQVAVDPILATGAGAALAIARVLRSRQKAREGLHDSPAAYLLRAEENLEAPSLTKKVLASLQRLRLFRPRGANSQGA